MKPRTRKQRAAVEAYRRRWPDTGSYVTDRLRRWAEDKVVRDTAVWSGRQAWCTACGGAFPYRRGILEVALAGGEAVCPHCGRRLGVVASRRRHDYHIWYVQELTTAGPYQVVNTYTVERSSAKGRPRRVWVQRVFSWMYGDDGNHLMSCGVKMGGFRYDNPWFGGAELELKTPGCGTIMDYYGGWIISGIYPVRRVNAHYRMLGLKGSTHGMDAGDLLRGLDTSSTVETLFKGGRYALAEAFLRHRMREKAWPSVKVALRHGLDLRTSEQVADFRDHLELLEKLGMDVRNPKNVAPLDFAEAHRLLQEKSRRHDERIRAEEERKRRLREVLNAEGTEAMIAAMDDEGSPINADYRRRLGNLLGVVVVQDGIELRPLQNIRDFYEEGEEMHHCVYTNHYFDHDHCLIIGAKVGGERTETIEIDTRSWTIVQCRGKFNQSSRHHDTIYKLASESLPRFRKSI